MTTFDLRSALVVSRPRRVPFAVVLAGLCLVLVLVAGCAGSEDSGVSCTPGEIATCTCDDGTSGVRTCGAEGTGYLQCQCAPVQDTVGGETGGDAKGETGKDTGGQSCKPDCAGSECGDDGCGGSCGTCQWGRCVDGACACTPSCKDKVCGPDACGGSCGTCAEGTHCSVNGVCEGADPCQEMANLYCCAADKVWTCTEGVLDIFEDCGASESTCGLVDQWDWVDVDCGTLDEILPPGDPAASVAPSCPGCVPDCAGRECGTDGCGGLCAACPGGKLCDLASFTCVNCVPACQGHQCGDDGCGGSCGACPGGSTCAGSLCVPEAWTCDSAYYGGDDGCDCECGAVDPDCADAEASVYGCDTGETCGSDGHCVPCVPSCEGKVCGYDGCGGTCDPCPVGKTCDFDAEVCVDCQPDCEGLVCGDDGCGGSCGACPGGSACANGQCVPETWTCNGTYYAAADGCDCDCGAYDPDCADPTANVYGCEYKESCGMDGTCQPCVPSCVGKTCGDDGCGGSCGSCASDEFCDTEEAACQHDPCADLGAKECCMGNVWYACETGVGLTPYVDCNENGRACGMGLSFDDVDLGCSDLAAWMSPAAADAPFAVGCGGCVPACSGTECGHDGCGGLCGSCPAGTRCDLTQGACVACQPDCSWKACGDDGCGGSCGACAQGICMLGVCAPATWTCDPDYYDAADGCDCGCGAYDPDCADPDALVYGCDDGLVCNAQGTCVAP